MGFFIFNGKSSVDYGVQIEKYPVRPYPERIYDSYTVPGRSGDLVLSLIHILIHYEWVFQV